MNLILKNMFRNLSKIRKNLALCEIGQYTFYLGTILLSTTNLLAGIFYLISLIISFKIRLPSLKKDKWNLTLLICSILLIISSFKIASVQNSDLFYENAKKLFWDPSSIWLSLFNWIPLFFVFYGFQLYLKSEKQRIKFAKCLFIGLIPVLISFFIQQFLKIYGPFEYLYGLIVFYLKPVDSTGYSGLFNNPNYAGLWLSSSLPFLIMIFKLNRYKKLKEGFILTIIFSTIVCIISTNSRNSLIGVLISTLFMTNIKFLILSILSIVLIYLLVINLNSFPLLETLAIDEIRPDKIFKKLLQTNYFSKFESPRLDIWKKAIILISEKPILGWGAATFPFLYTLRSGIMNANHTHSMPLEIAQMYGIPIAIILTLFVSFLFFKSWKIIFQEKSNLNTVVNKAWIISTLIILISHLSDVTYYDGRISLLIWTLLSGLKSILDESNDKSNNNISKTQI